MLLALTPGPDNIFVLLQSAQRGWRAGSVRGVGPVPGPGGHTAAVALGLAAVFAASGMAFTVLKVVGAAYLAWLAWGALRAPASVREAPPGERCGGRRQRRRPAHGGARRGDEPDES